MRQAAAKRGNISQNSKSHNANLGRPPEITPLYCVNSRGALSGPSYSIPYTLLNINAYMIKSYCRFVNLLKIKS